MVTQNSIMNLLIGKDVARTASATATDVSASTYLADGEIAVVDVSGTVLNTTTVQGKDRVRIIQSQGATLPSIQSPIIELAGVKDYSSKAYTVAVAQIDFIGYDNIANTGDFEVISDNGYEIVIKDINSSNHGSNGVEKFGFYVSDSTATKVEVLNGLAVNLTNNFAHVVYKPFIVERIAAVATGTDTTGAAGTLTFVNGSTSVTASVSSTGNGLVAGAYIRTDDSAVDTGAIYKVVSIDTATTLTIDQPYQAAGAAFTAGNAAVHTAAQLNAVAMGIKLTGATPTFVSPQENEYYVNRWIATIKNGGTTPVVTNTKALEGSGNYGQIASLEYFLEGNEGFIARNNFPHQNFRTNALAAGTYHLLNLEWNSRIGSSSILTSQESPKQLMMAFDFVAASAPTSALGAATSVQDVLNTWISSAIGSGSLA